ncbi:hypothetical protein D3C74_382620 [compost metagenome]
MGSTSADIRCEAFNEIAVQLCCIRRSQIQRNNDNFFIDLCRADVVNAEQMVQHALGYIAHISSTFLKICTFHILEHFYELRGYFI